MTGVSKVRIIGTSHISKESAKDIRSAYDSFKPDIIAVELDRRRLTSLKDMAARGKHQLPPPSMIRHVGLVGYIFILVGGWLQRKLAGIVKVQPGIDMLEAVKIAGESGKKLALVDQDVMITLKRLSKTFDWRHKLRLLWDIISSPFQKQKIKIKITKVPSKKTIEKLMRLLKERYPALYEVFIVERNIFMASRLDHLARSQPGVRILLVVGAGHEDDLRMRLKSSGVFSVE